MTVGVTETIKSMLSVVAPGGLDPARHAGHRRRARGRRPPRRRRGHAVQSLDHPQGSEATRTSTGCTASPPGCGSHPEAIRAASTADIVRTAGEEDASPWRLAPIRARRDHRHGRARRADGRGVAGGGHLGVATGTAVTDHGRWRRIDRPARGAAVPRGSPRFIGLPLDRRRVHDRAGPSDADVPVTLRRAGTACIGTLVGWGVNSPVRSRSDPPRRPPGRPGVGRALVDRGARGARCRGACSVHRVFIGRAGAGRVGRTARRPAAWSSSMHGGRSSPSPGPRRRSAPGGRGEFGEHDHRRVVDAFFLVAVLRATATVGAVRGRWLGGVYVPFLAIGDLTGRVVAPLVAPRRTSPLRRPRLAGRRSLPPAVDAMAIVVTLGGPATAAGGRPTARPGRRRSTASVLPRRSTSCGANGESAPRWVDDCDAAPRRRAGRHRMAPGCVAPPLARPRSCPPPSLLGGPGTHRPSAAASSLLTIKDAFTLPWSRYGTLDSATDRSAAGSTPR